jgi:sterol desaturase/sphingolipid hydroxylase (fatty acid hydroxylase superfamily)
MAVRLVIFVTLLAATAGAGIANLHQQPALLIALFILGLLAWTIIEYLLHRFAFHGFAPHWQHHEKPTDPVFIVAPLSLSLSASAILFALFSLAARSLPSGATILAGVIAGYIAYEAVHLRIHSSAAGGPILRTLRRHHYYHHFASDQVCYGVTSPIWDFIFQTRPRP